VADDEYVGGENAMMGDEARKARIQRAHSPSCLIGRLMSSRRSGKSVDSQERLEITRVAGGQPLEPKRAQTTVRIDRLNNFPFISMLHTASHSAEGVEVLQPKFCRCRLDIAPAPKATSTYAFYLISGEMFYGSSRCSATAGDLLLVAEGAKIGSALSGNFRALLLIMGEFELLHIDNSQSPVAIHISRHQLLAPLASCLSFISSRFSSASEDEYEMLYAAACGLLPLAIARSGRPTEPVARSVALKLQKYVERELQDPDLNAAKVAGHFGISVRYVHKLFAQQGLTLGDYIKTKRLEQVHFDLTAPVSREQKIAVIAKKWGFADLSTFARAFKGKYGYKPSEAKFT
jgi:AraC-like DNA-binding protein